VSIFGIMLILRPQLEYWTLYHSLGIACVLLWAVSAVLTKFSAQNKSPLAVSIYYYVIFGTIGTLIFSVPALQTVDYSFWLAFLAIGLVNTVGNFFMFMSFKYGSGYLVQMMEFLKFVFIVIIDIVMFDVEIKNETIVGSSIVLAAIFAIFFLQRKPIKHYETLQE
jgi:drug/metabolite transporter (DMT)-like permease